MVMGLKDIFNKKKIENLEDTIQDLYNQVNSVPKQKNTTIISETMIKESMYRNKQTIQKWRDSLDYVEGTNNTTDPLYQIFREIYLDPQIQSTILLRKSRITQLPFKIESLNDNETINEEVEKILDKKWFYDFMNMSLEYLYTGYVAVEITKVNSDKTITIENIPFNHLKPRYSKFVKGINDLYTSGIDLTSDPYVDYVMEIYDNKNDLGIYTKIIPLFLWSRNAQQSWSQYSEKFGMPIVIGRTVKQDAGERKNIFNMLKNMGSSLATLLDNEDKIEIIQNSSTDAYQVYNELIKICNDQISKLILGATMVNSDGSSYSQSQTHQQQFDSLIKMDIRSMEHIVNDILFPRLINLGIIPEGVKFEFDTSESLNIFQKFEIDKALLTSYDLDIDYLNKKYNTFITNVKNTPLI